MANTEVEMSYFGSLFGSPDEFESFRNFMHQQHVKELDDFGLPYESKESYESRNMEFILNKFEKSVDF
jgi:hypothetical protein